LLHAIIIRAGCGMKMNERLREFSSLFVCDDDDCDEMILNVLQMKIISFEVDEMKPNLFQVVRIFLIQSSSLTCFVHDHDWQFNPTTETLVCSKTVPQLMLVFTKMANLEERYESQRNSAFHQTFKSSLIPSKGIPTKYMWRKQPRFSREPHFDFIRFCQPPGFSFITFSFLPFPFLFLDHNVRSSFGSVL
jgi:hypothetical protein